MVGWEGGLQHKVKADFIIKELMCRNLGNGLYL